MGSSIGCFYFDLFYIHLNFGEDQINFEKKNFSIQIAAFKYALFPIDLDTPSSFIPKLFLSLILSSLFSSVRCCYRSYLDINKLYKVFKYMQHFKNLLWSHKYECRDLSLVPLFPLFPTFMFNHTYIRKRRKESSSTEWTFGVL